MDTIAPKTVSLHGRSMTYLEAGSGPVLLLIHGMAGTCENWQAVIEPLAARHTVLAPDLPGHGSSAPGGGDYSLGALAAGLRDLLVALGHERATLVGHSLGGGIAMQFAYQFPEATERLVLVSAAGSVRRSVPSCAPPRSRARTGSSPLRLDLGASRDRRWRAAWRPSGCGRTPTSPRSRADTRRSPTEIGAPRSWPPCAPWSAPGASASTPATGSTWPRGCRS